MCFSLCYVHVSDPPTETVSWLPDLCSCCFRANSEIDSQFAYSPIKAYSRSPSLRSLGLGAVCTLYMVYLQHYKSELDVASFSNSVEELS